MQRNFRSRFAFAVALVTALSMPFAAGLPAQADPASLTGCADLAIKGIKNSTRTIDLESLSGCINSVTDGPINFVLNYAPLATFNSGLVFIAADSSETPLLDPQAVGSQDLEVVDPSALKLKATVAATYVLEITATPFDLTDPAVAGTTTTFQLTFTTYESATLPTCTKLSAGTTKNVAVVLDLTGELASYGSGCSAAAGSDLQFFAGTDTSVTADNHSHGTISIDNANDEITFTPEVDFVSPKGWIDDASQYAIRAWFTFYAVDDYGQRTNDYRVFVQVSPQPVYNANCNPKSEVIFNTPAGTDSQQFAITNKIIQYINCAPSGSVITMSWFSITDYSFVTALKSAKARGVNVRFLVNSHATKPASSSFGTWTSLKRVLGTNPHAGSRDGSTYVANTSNGTPSGSWAMYCDWGCLTPPKPAGIDTPGDSEGEYPALHSKFFMVSNINGESVVGIASSNPTVAQAVNGWNNAQIISEKASSRKTLFASLNRYFADMASQACRSTCPNPTKRNLPASHRTLASVNGNSFITFPHLGTGTATDDIAVELTKILNEKKCVRYVNGKKKRTQIHVNMFVFTRNSVAALLWKLANNRPINGGGCDIHLIYTDMDQAIRDGGTWLTKKDGGISWGALDCITTPATSNGKFQALTTPSRRYLKDAAGNIVRTKKGKIRYTTVNVCSRGVLQGRMPTINNYTNSYCWFKSTSAVSGGSTDVCVSTPLTLTGQDPADLRTKLEAVKDSAGRNRYSHQKYMLIKTYDWLGKPAYKTFSGTPNFTSPGLRWNDEIMIISTNKTTYTQYLANYVAMRKWITGRVGTSIWTRSCRYYTTC